MAFLKCNLLPMILWKGKAYSKTIIRMIVIISFFILLDLFQIYNEDLMDLLCLPSQRQPLTIREEHSGEIKVFDFIHNKQFQALHFPSILDTYISLHGQQ